MHITLAQQLVDNSLAARCRVRAAAHARYSDARVPVRVVPGAGAPRLRGSSWHYTTRTGIPVRHPSAYSKVGWSSLRYHAATRRVDVGVLWLLGHRVLAAAARDVQVTP